MLRTNSMIILVANATAIMATTANAQTADQIAAKFTAADTNHDGKLTPEEAKAGMPKVYKNFAKIDTAKKGYVTLEAIMATFNAHK
jgi:hypothetical protein